MRYWCNKKQDDGSIHAIGNGRFIVYGKGPDINQFQGPTYSTPAYCGLVLDEVDRVIECKSKRENRNSAWNHKVYEDSNLVNEFYDYMDCEYNVFVREFINEKNINLKIVLHPNCELHYYKDYDIGSEKKDVVMLVIRKGAPYFTGFALIEEIRMYIYCDGDCEYIPEQQSFVLWKGKGKLIFISSSPNEIQKHMEFAISDLDIADRSKSFFSTYLEHGNQVLDMIPENHIEKKRITEVLESVAVLIKCQQSYDGGIMAGHYYPMAYVRDQAGTMRGLLKMGYINEAKKVLEFWFQKWSIFGNLLNAESMGHNNDRLMFSNDEVEIPAYVLVCAFAYLEKTSDKAFILSIFSMLKWAYTVQLPHLVDGMTGFSGDETYLAGSTFPKTFVYHGSSESTLLFIESGMMFVRFAESEKLLEKEELELYKKKNDEARKAYKTNFVKEGMLYCNNPERETNYIKPRFHRGFCDVDSFYKRPAPLMWLEKGEHDYYRCPDCFHDEIKEQIDPKTRFMISSTSMLPRYHGSDLFSKEEIRQHVLPYIQAFKEKGFILSNIEGNRSLGYDFGLLLLNLSYLNDPLKEEALKVMLDIVDGTDSWVEYYDDMKAYNCRCRPWESAINIEALIYYLESELCI